MRFTWDLDAAYIVLTPGARVKLTTAEMIRSGAFPVEIQFLDEGLAGPLKGDDPQLGFVIKPAGKFDAVAYALIDDFVYDVTIQAYRGTLNLITTELNELFKKNENPDDDLPFVATIAGFGYRPDGSSPWVPSNTIATTLLNNVFRGDEIAPAPDPTDEDWLNSRAVRYDSVQSLNLTQQARARTNIGISEGGAVLARWGEILGDIEEQADLLALIQEKQGANVQVFHTSGTWTKPANAINGRMLIVGGGGAGAGGKRGTPIGATVGGGGGSGAAWVDVPFTAASFSATESVIVGAAGTAGAGSTTNGVAGADGGDGGTSSFGTISAVGGKGGKGAGTAGATTATSNYIYPLTAAVVTMIGGAQTAAPGNGSVFYPCGGGGGGSVQYNAPDLVLINAGQGSPTSGQAAVIPGRILGGAAGVADGEAGAHGASQPFGGSGAGGGGGKGSLVGVGGNGGNGGTYGGGGGGGGAALDGFSGGNGGAGGAGIVIVITYCAP